jgi:hypothetical protein
MFERDRVTGERRPEGPDATCGPAAELVQRVTDLLNGCLGASPFQFGAKPSERAMTTPTGPWRTGLYAGLAYALLFCALPALLMLGQPELHLFWLSVYGSLYAAWATAIARSASMDVLEIVKGRIAPALSHETIHRINNDLDRGYQPRRLLLVSWSVAILGAISAGWAIRLDVLDHPVQIAWWCVGWLYLFVTAARATYVARFYFVFAKHLPSERQHLYRFNPAHSALVMAIAAVGQRILLFWVGIALSIALLIPFASIGAKQGVELRDYLASHTLLLHAQSAFVLLVVPITSVFSLPFGTFVFLRSEKAIRKTVDYVLDDTLRSTEREIANLLAEPGDLGEGKRKRLDALMSLHTSVATSGSYSNPLIRGLSLLVPLIGPAVALLEFWLKAHAG